MNAFNAAAYASYRAQGVRPAMAKQLAMISISVDGGYVTDEEEEE